MSCVVLNRFMILSDRANNGISNSTVITTVQPNKNDEAFNDVTKNKNNKPSTTDVPALSTKMSIKKHVMWTWEHANVICCRMRCMIEVVGVEVEVEVEVVEVEVEVLLLLLLMLPTCFASSL